MAPLSRSSLQKLASAKVDDARLLFENKRYPNSYYLYGYGVELGLKACIARQILAETIPDKTILTRVMTHKIIDLIGLAGLSPDLKDRRVDREFDARWAVVSEWSEESRYEMIDVVLAAAMRDAVEHPAHGVMTWLKQHW
jgi:HEPN domain-containing protein